MRPCYGIFNDREWPQVQEFAEHLQVNVSELIRRGIRALAREHHRVVAIDERKDYWARTRRRRR